MQQNRARPNPAGMYFLSQHGTPYSVKTISGVVEQVIRGEGLGGTMSIKQFRKIGASLIKMVASTDAMHQYKANALSTADQPYILEDYSLLTAALKRLREKLLEEGVL
jgi:hypothetical protein